MATTNIQKINYSYAAFDYARRHIAALSDAQRQEELDAAKEATEDDSPFLVGIYWISPETYARIILGGETIALEIGRLEERLGLQNDDAGIKRHIHSLLINTKGNTQKAAIIEGVPESELTQIIHSEGIYEDDYRWINWSLVKEEPSAIDEAASSSYFTVREEAFRALVPEFTRAWQDFRRMYFKQALRIGNRNKAQSARNIGMSRFGLIKGMQRCRIKSPSQFFEIRGDPQELPTYREARIEFLKLYAHQIMTLNKGNLSRAAREVGRISRFGLMNMMRSAGLDPAQYRDHFMALAED